MKGLHRRNPARQIYDPFRVGQLLSTRVGFAALGFAIYPLWGKV